MKWDNIGNYPGLPAETFWTVGKIISGTIATVYVVVAAVLFGPADAFDVVTSSALILLFIWFPEIMAQYEGWGVPYGRPILRSSPLRFVYYGGWMLLLLPLVQILLIVWGTGQTPNRPAG